jgi:hypothetical protein
VREASGVATLSSGPSHLAKDYETFSVKPESAAVSLAGIELEPVEFRVKSDLRNHQAIVQPRLYDSLMVTQITLTLSSMQAHCSGDSCQ